MRTNIFFYSFMFLLILSNVQANAAAIAASIAAQNADDERAEDTRAQIGCTPPINFSLEHNCTLRIRDSYSIQEYRCGDYEIVGDCLGGVRQVSRREDPFAGKGGWFILAGVALIVLYPRLFPKDKTKGKKEDDLF